MEEIIKKYHNSERIDSLAIASEFEDLHTCQFGTWAAQYTPSKLTQQKSEYLS